MATRTKRARQASPPDGAQTPIDLNAWVKEQEQKITEYLAQAEVFKANAHRAEAAAASLREALNSLVNGVAHGNNNSAESAP